MGGAESQDVREDLWPPDPGPSMLSRAEEEREAAAKRREIRKFKFLKERLVFNLWQSPLDYLYTFSMLFRQVVSPCDPGPHLSPSYSAMCESEEEEEKEEEEKEEEEKEEEDEEEGVQPFLCEEDEWYEEKREDPAKRREIRKFKFLKERLVFNRYSTMPFTMGGVKEKLQYFERLCEEDEWAEEEREAAAALKREIREMEFLEEYFALNRELLSHHDPFISRSFSTPEAKRAYSPAPSCESMKSVHFPVGSNRAEEGTVQVPAMDREIMEMKFLEEQFALRQGDFWSREPDPFFFPSFGFSPEQERAGSPALSCGSMMSDDSMDYPMAF